MESLIHLINDLQDAFAGVDDCFALGLPQIAVVGSQSAGKSSVLENVVGRDFLPRGSGIVTRRPLILQLINLRGTTTTAAFEGTRTEYGEFLHKRNQYIYDFHEIRREIEQETERICGSNKGVSSTPINLRIYSDRVLDLTLIDLPGMTKVPVGDQPPDIEVQIRQLILQFVQQPNCLILAVSPANADLANSDALQMAREVDPEGVRTIAVLTKLDLMDEGTDARAVLRNEVVPLRYGYVGVVNRSQKDIEDEKDIDAALQAEHHFFTTHPSYNDMADRMGTDYLQKALHFHLTRHIAEAVPELRTKLERQRKDLEKRLEGGVNGNNKFDYDDPYWKAKALVMMVVRFARDCRIELLGHFDEANCVGYDNLCCGARINQLFQVTYPSLLADVEFAKEVEMKKAIGFAIQNTIGVRTALFTPDKAFDQIVRKQIGKLREPTVQLIELTWSEIMKAVDAGLKGMKRFPSLAKYVESMVSNRVLHQMQKTRDATNELLDYEYSYINARHEDFVGFKRAEHTADQIVCDRKNPGMQVFTSGWLTLSTQSAFSMSHKYWFVLTHDNFSWYLDATLQECKYRIPLEGGGLRFIDHERNNEFSIISDSEKHNVYKDSNRLDFIAPSYNQFDEWRAGFMKVGVFCSSASASVAASMVTKTTVSSQIMETSDPHLERQIEIIWVLIASYMRIVCRTLEDMIPKVIVRLLIKDTIQYLEERFVADVSLVKNIDELLEENEQEVEERKKLKRRYQACQLALEKLKHVRIPKTEGFQGETRNASSFKPDRKPSSRPSIPPRPASQLIMNEQAVDVDGVCRRTGSIPSRSQRQQQEKGGDKQLLTRAADREDVQRERASYRAPSKKLTAGQIQKAQMQIDSSKKSTFYT